ncbi:toll/interleukin-1 receptor domain-containing protein [Hyalangium sp.]|uniref:toll/interleukin-1 receptor domain-containing protein n=1 Tax=Hyalangium sp. TaxID=2028555 RepID=UPI002D75260B|nr:toll/interleukin-1 receptor domain-containing protein [Hyalangium sp.]HYH98956.1 toll/interleukin-1 receptor domain-containing protein [Hyalangium sp.]
MQIFVIGSVAVGENDPGFPNEKMLLKRTCQGLGKAIRVAGHTAVLCSPFPDSADLEVLRGVAAAGGTTPVNIEMHFPDEKSVRQRLDEVQHELGLVGIKPYPYMPPQGHMSSDAWRYAWLLCQLSALESSQVVIAVGGKLEGAANMLLLLAEAKRKVVLPVTFLGGAAQQAYYRRRYELQDRLGKGAEMLLDKESVEGLVVLAERSALSALEEHRPKGERGMPLRFFISYPRARPLEADHVETLLRRRNMQVFRDETDFGAGHEIPGRIQEAIHSANVFIALWCKEYACSPWCFDELELALKRHSQGVLNLWILCVDDTRIVPPGIRNLVHFPVRSREELEGRVLELLERARARVD